jgi:small subunit ribosomal protein S8
MDSLDFLLASLKAGSHSLRAGVYVRRSHMVEAILELLYREGFIRGYEISGSSRFWVELKYVGMRPVLKDFTRCSVPSRQLSLAASELQRKYSAKKIIVSTSSGLYLGTSKGGVPLFYIN